MENKLCSINTNLEQINSMFDVANECFYNKTLSMPIINLTFLQKKLIHSRYIPAIWNGINKQEISEIIIDSSLAKTGGAMKIFKELLYCLVLHYCDENNIQCRSRGGTYLNKRFYEIATSHGLVCQKNKRFGYIITGLNTDAKDLIKKYGWSFVVQREKSTYGKNTKLSVSNSIKYICPKCNTSVRATKEVSIMCIPCQLQMKQEVM